MRPFHIPWASDPYFLSTHLLYPFHCFKGQIISTRVLVKVSPIRMFTEHLIILRCLRSASGSSSVFGETISQSAASFAKTSLGVSWLTFPVSCSQMLGMLFFFFHLNISCFLNKGLRVGATYSVLIVETWLLQLYVIIYWNLSHFKVFCSWVSAVQRQLHEIDSEIVSYHVVVGGYQRMGRMLGYAWGWGSWWGRQFANDRGSGHWITGQGCRRAGNKCMFLPYSHALHLLLV